MDARRPVSSPTRWSSSGWRWRGVTGVLGPASLLGLSGRAGLRLPSDARREVAPPVVFFLIESSAAPLRCLKSAAFLLASSLSVPYEGEARDPIHFFFRL